MFKLITITLLAASCLCSCADIFVGQDPAEYNPELEALARQRIISGKVQEVIYRGGYLYIDGIKMPEPLPSLRY